MSTVFSDFLNEKHGRRIQLARDLRVTPSNITQWLNKRIPAERVLEIERITGLSRHDLRPDIYPRADK